MPPAAHYHLAVGVHDVAVVSQAHHVPTAHRCHDVAVGKETNRFDGARMSVPRVEWFAGGGIEEADRVASAAKGQDLIIW
jgi:hypothetical protein